MLTLTTRKVSFKCRVLWIQCMPMVIEIHIKDIRMSLKIALSNKDGKESVNQW